MKKENSEINDLMTTVDQSVVKRLVGVLLNLYSCRSVGFQPLL